VVVLGSDRLVLRRGTSVFWAAVTCQHCGGELASIDASAHDGPCRVATVSRADNTISLRSQRDMAWVRPGSSGAPSSQHRPRTRRMSLPIWWYRKGKPFRMFTGRTLHWKPGRRVGLYAEAVTALAIIVLAGVLVIVLIVWLGSAFVPRS